MTTATQMTDEEIIIQKLAKIMLVTLVSLATLFVFAGAALTMLIH